MEPRPLGQPLPPGPQEHLENMHRVLVLLKMISYLSELHESPPFRTFQVRWFFDTP